MKKVGSAHFSKRPTHEESEHSPLPVTTGDSLAYTLGDDKGDGLRYSGYWKALFV